MDILFLFLIISCDIFYRYIYNADIKNEIVILTRNYSAWSYVLSRRNENPANTKHLYNICTTLVQRLRRWSNIVHMLYKCFVVTGIVIHNVNSEKITQSIA